MDVIAHRGFAEEFPENTLSAFQQASTRVQSPRSPVTAVEFDVRGSQSGEPVVIHDEAVDRVTDGTGRVAEHTVSELQSYTVLESPDHVPTLAEVMDAMPAEVPVQVEIKDAGLAERVLSVVDAHRPAVRITSFNPETLAEVRSIDSTIPLGFLFDDRRAPLFTAVEHGCTSVHPSVNRCIETDIVDRAKQVKFDVIAWHVNTAADVRGIHAAGVDGFTADHAQLAEAINTEQSKNSAGAD